MAYHREYICLYGTASQVQHQYSIFMTIQLLAKSACRFNTLEWRSTSSTTSLIFNFSVFNCIIFPSPMKVLNQLKIRCHGDMCPDDILNLSSRKVGSVLSRFKTVVLIFIVVLALAGRCARKTRHVFEGFVNGLNLVVTSTMCFVIIAAHPQVAEERISQRI